MCVCVCVCVYTMSFSISSFRKFCCYDFVFIYYIGFVSVCFNAICWAGTDFLDVE